MAIYFSFGLCFFVLSVFGGNPGIWQCLDGITCPLRINENGDVECMSENNRDCLWGQNCQTLLNHASATIKPLACGDMHKSQWGGTGYDDEDHWCRKGRNILRLGCIAPRAYKDLGYGDMTRGWYDYQGQGCCNDYCRYVGDKSQNWFSCAVAGADNEYTPMSMNIKEANLQKCTKKGDIVSLPARGPPGKAGSPGSGGPIGPFGAPGPAGVPGRAGPPGPEGPRGAKGSVGDPGDNGYRGAAGVDGVQGPVGAPGAQGAPGATGPAGPPGRAPPRGSPIPAPGPQGPDGYPGATGATGPAGSTGALGATGETGLNGQKGATGPTGYTGPIGPTGVQGDKGEKGEAGATGEKGLLGATGPAGAMGIIGGTGPVGVPGVTGIDGATGVTGPIGPTGETGVAGASVDVDVVKAAALKQAEILSDQVVAHVQWPEIPAKQFPSDDVLEKVIDDGLKDLNYIKLTKKVRASLDNSLLESDIEDLKSEIWRLKHLIDYTDRKRRQAEKRYQDALLPDAPPVYHGN